MRVSVVIPFYNRVELLRNSIGSVLAQTRPADEIVVVDDRSPEDTGWLPLEFPTVRILRLPRNMGPMRARYEGVAATTGTHVATLDMDDVWYPQKLEKQIAYAEKTGDSRAIYTHLQWVNEGETGSVRPQKLLQPGEPLGDYFYVRNESLQTNTFLVERTLYLHLAHIAEGYYAEDMELLLEAEARHCRIYIQEEVLSQWNCLPDPRRGSYAYDETHLRRLLRDQGMHLTPKAQAAFKGRALARCLAEQGRYGEAGKMLWEAVSCQALSPAMAAKLALLTLFPGAFRRAAGWYRRLSPSRQAAPTAEARSDASAPGTFSRKL